VISQRYNATLEGSVYGTLQVNNQSYIANEYMSSQIDLKKKTITFTINIPITEQSAVFYNIFIDDNYDFDCANYWINFGQ
jgi:hypothetical protein